jgi:hypothetical protein
VAFANLIGLLSGDKSLEGTAFSFEKITAAVQKTIAAVSTFTMGLIRTEELLAHLLNAATLLASGNMGKALQEVRAAASVFTPAQVGRFLGSTMAMPGGGELGAMVGERVEALMGNRTGAPLNLPLAQRAYSAAQQASSKLGIPAELIWSQWAHETGGFKQLGAQNNLGGIEIRKGVYQPFGSLDDFVQKYVSILSGHRYAGLSHPSTPEEMAHFLKQGSYYEDTEANYAAGLHRWSDRMQITNHTTVNVNVQHPGATADEIATVTARKVEDAQTKRIQRNLAEFGLAGVTY